MMIGLCKKLLLIDELEMCVEALIDSRTKYPPIWVVVNALFMQDCGYAARTAISPHHR